MNHSTPRLLLVVLGLLLAASASPGAPASAATTHAQNNATRTRERIDALLKRRLTANPLPAGLPNPFVVSGGAAVAEQPDATPAGDPTPKIPVEQAPATDAENLARYAAALKIGGTLQLNGRMQLIINQSPYKEGDLVFLDNRNSVTYLQVIRITASELTLGYNQAVLTVKIKGN